ncbi:hypothetical protein [Streptomyces sp. NPDC101145]|uniref:hypothetical protein n=1 Tax=Streptomyces sp. NPDC101145 TaxID=3366112 RepID=UPI0038056F21
MLSSLPGIDVLGALIVAAAICFVVYCVTARSMFKIALTNTRSADRPRVIRQFGGLLRALFTLRRR